jgi:hypothetical protein
MFGKSKNLKQDPDSFKVCFFSLSFWAHVTLPGIGNSVLLLAGQTKSGIGSVRYVYWWCVL